MLPAFCRPKEREMQLRRALPHQRLRFVDSWAAFVRVAAHHHCSLVWLERLAGKEYESIVALSRISRLQPWILITDPSPENLRHLAGVLVHDVRFPNELQDLASLVSEAANHRALRQVEECCRTAIPQTDLSQALCICCSIEPPIATTAELATLVGRDRRTIWHHWIKLPNGKQVHLKEVIDDILRLRALVLLAAGQSRREVATKLGISKHKLAGFRTSATRMRGNRPTAQEVYCAAAELIARLQQVGMGKIQ